MLVFDIPGAKLDPAVFTLGNAGHGSVETAAGEGQLADLLWKLLTLFAAEAHAPTRSLASHA